MGGVELGRLPYFALPGSLSPIRILAYRRRPARAPTNRRNPHNRGTPCGARDALVELPFKRALDGSISRPQAAASHDESLDPEVGRAGPRGPPFLPYRWVCARLSLASAKARDGCRRGSRNGDGLDTAKGSHAGFHSSRLRTRGADFA